MSDFFDDSHVTDVGMEGSAGPSVGVWDMVQQGFQQQFRVDSQRALDAELQARWLESLQALCTSGQNFNAPVNPLMYRNFAQFVREGTPVTMPTVEGSGYGARVNYDLQQPHPEFEEMRRANEAIRQLNNPDIKTFEQILEEVSAMQRNVEMETASMSERSGTFGVVGELLGAIGGSFTTRDPLNIVTAPIGAGRTIAARIGTDMLVAAGVVTATEFGDVAPNRALAELPERNPLYNIVAATLGAGVIRGAVIEPLGYAARRFRERGVVAEDIDFDLRDSQLRQMFESAPDTPTTRAGIEALDDAVFIERNNPYGEGQAAQARFLAELQDMQRALNGEPMTAVARVLPPIPFEYIQKAADFEIVREQAPLVYARMEQAQARVANIERQITDLAAPRLYHQGPIDLPGNVPTHKEGNFFGTAEFDETFRAEFGPTRYSYRVPQELSTKTLKVSQDNVEEVIQLFSKNWPEEQRDQIAAALRQGDRTAWSDFYSEDWTLGTPIASALEGTNYLGARYGDETFLTPTGIAELRFEGSGSALGPTGRTRQDLIKLRADRRATNRDYHAAYRAVEAEAIRLREAQARIEAAQQRESVSIFLPTVKDRMFIGPELQHSYVESLVDRINKFNDTLDEKAVAAFVRQAEGEEVAVPAAWLTEDGRVDIGLAEPVDPEFRFDTDEGEMTVAAAMRDLQDDADLDDAMRTCLL